MTGGCVVGALDDGETVPVLGTEMTKTSKRQKSDVAAVCAQQAREKAELWRGPPEMLEFRIGRLMPDDTVSSCLYSRAMLCQTDCWLTKEQENLAAIPALDAGE